MKTLDLNNYKKEDLLLKDAKLSFNKSTFQCESDFALEEKIAFCDKMLDGKATELINLLIKLQSEVGTVVKITSTGQLNKSSLNSWLNKNDMRKLLSNYEGSSELHCANCGVEYSYYTIKTTKDITICPSGRYGNMEHSGSHIGHQIFHDLLVKLAREEAKYFTTVDPIYVTYLKLKEIAQGRNIFECEPLNMLLWNDIKMVEKFDITIQDMERWIRAYEDLDEYIKKVSVNL